MLRQSALVALTLTAIASGEALADDDLAGAATAYDEAVRHRLPEKLTAVVDGAFDLDGLRLGRALPELWRQIRDDPDLQALFANIVEQYKPRLDYSAYVGTVGESTKYVGAAVGVEADLAAPLCRYIGGAFNGHAYDDPEGSGLAWDTRVTGCLPWGPFALELGFVSQRDVRVGLAAPPTSGAGRFDSLGFELRIRGFRWLHTGWELVTLPTEVSFIDFAPDRDDGVETATFTINSAAVRFVRYGAGAGGQDRVVEGLPVRVVGEQDSVGEMLSSVVVGVGAVSWRGARLAPWLYLDGNAMFQLGTIGSTMVGAEPEITVATGAVDAAVHALIAGFHNRARYRRGLLPDDELRLLVEDRGELDTRFVAGAHSIGAGAFAAYTRTAATPDGVAARARAGSYGVHLDYGRSVFGPVYVTARTEAARSYYASAGGDVLARPEVELRAIFGVAAAWSSAEK